MSREIKESQVMMCLICGYKYEESKGDIHSGIPAGTKWEDIPDDWVCPECSVDKSDFVRIDL